MLSILNVNLLKTEVRIPFTFVPVLEQAYFKLSLYVKNILH